MAPRLSNSHSEDIRKKIAASQLINRLTKHANGDLDLTPSQVRSIEILLKKSVPDLSAVTIDGDLTITMQEKAIRELE
jgi:hypothetical protein